MGAVTSRRVSGMPPTNRVAWVPLHTGGYYGCDLYGTVVRVTRLGGIWWYAFVTPFMGDTWRFERTRSLTAARCRAKVDRALREG